MNINTLKKDEWPRGIINNLHDQKQIGSSYYLTKNIKMQLRCFHTSLFAILGNENGHIN